MALLCASLFVASGCWVPRMPEERTQSDVNMAENAPTSKWISAKALASVTPGRFSVCSVLIAVLVLFSAWVLPLTSDFMLE